MTTEQEVWEHYAHEHNLCVECGIPYELTELTEESTLQPCEKCVERQREFFEEIGYCEVCKELAVEEGMCINCTCICDENGEPPWFENGMELTCYCRLCREARAEAERLYKQTK